MARTPYIVGGIPFDTKEALKRHAQAILQRARPGQQLDLVDTAFMTDLFERHPSAEEKIGVGVAALRVERMAVENNGRTFHTVGFVIERIDGTRIDISYNQCIRPFTHATKVKFALRRAIADQVIAVKARIFPQRGGVVPCPITGQPMSADDAHVDHTPPATFAALVAAWMDARGLTFDDIALTETATGIGAGIPPEVATDWATFHQDRAHLRVISAYANLNLVGRR